MVTSQGIEYFAGNAAAPAAFSFGSMLSAKLLTHGLDTMQQQILATQPKVINIIRKAWKVTKRGKFIQA